MFPQEKSAAVSRAVQEALGVAGFEDIRDLTGGRGTNPVFRIVVRGSPFLLRINLRAGDLERHYSSMRAAAEAGLAPRVWYTNVDERISITDFVEVVPFPAASALPRLAGVLRRLHALPPFARVPDPLNTSCMFLINKGPALDAFLEKFRAADLLPKDESAKIFETYARVAAAYQHIDAEMVSSHNDLFKPDNILFDGNRVWLVDWEAAFLNDRYADLAVVANLLVTDEEEESIYLQEYFGAAPDEYQLARLFLARQLAHIFYAMAFLWLGSSGQPVDWSEAVPEFRDFQRRFWAGEVKLEGGQTKIAYGRIHLERLLDNTRCARFEEVIRIVADRNGRAGAASRP